MKQPVAIAMRTGYPFGLGGMWENCKEPASGEWLRTFAIITTDANEPWRRNSQPGAVLVSARHQDGDREHCASAC
jgi:putative SOS response-associated peptidase YedK